MQLVSDGEATAEATAAKEGGRLRGTTRRPSCQQGNSCAAQPHGLDFGNAFNKILKEGCGDAAELTTRTYSDPGRRSRS